MQHRILVLGSISPARRALLSRLQIPFEITDPRFDESALIGLPLIKLTKMLEQFDFGPI